ncbi:MAG: N-(5'-phosphoribosyl)anthranilate isomerase [Rhodobacterales bacterium]|nr:MAG: N-(5'-phosphoribosyl)anthranilate isomerase [Rhodobacterales bacterium]
MTNLPPSINPETWMRSVFSSRDVRRGGVFKRQVRDVERIVGRDVFLAEVERRGFQALENGRHFIVCCNAQPIRRVRAGPSSARADASRGRAPAPPLP